MTVEYPIGGYAPGDIMTVFGGSGLAMRLDTYFDAQDLAYDFNFQVGDSGGPATLEVLDETGSTATPRAIHSSGSSPIRLSERADKRSDRFATFDLPRDRFGQKSDPIRLTRFSRQHRLGFRKCRRGRDHIVSANAVSRCPHRSIGR
ncbi:MAG: hypothetical protein AAF922_18330 [Pseudomonadota bacterium]